MVDPNRAPLEGVVEVDQAEIPFRAGDALFEPGNAGKILVIGAVEVIDRDSNQAKPRRKHDAGQLTNTTASQTKRRLNLYTDFQQNWPSFRLLKISSLLAFSNL
jgi:hypothetical protein